MSNRWWEEPGTKHIELILTILWHLMKTLRISVAISYSVLVSTGRLYIYLNMQHFIQEPVQNLMSTFHISVVCCAIILRFCHISTLCASLVHSSPKADNQKWYSSDNHSGCDCDSSVIGEQLRAQTDRCFPLDGHN